MIFKTLHLHRWQGTQQILLSRILGIVRAGMGGLRRHGFWKRRGAAPVAGNGLLMPPQATNFSVTHHKEEIGGAWNRLYGKPRIGSRRFAGTAGSVIRRVQEN